MSFLTKKSLLLMVLSILCNRALSDRTDECKELPPDIAFKFAMFSLSKKFMESMTTTQALGNRFEYQSIVLQDNNDFKTKHMDILNYFSFLGDRIKSQDITSIESKREDIIGYYQSFVKKFNEIQDVSVIEDLAQSPEQFCLTHYPEGISKCRRALAHMLHVPIGEVKKMKTKRAYIFTYLTYSFFDLVLHKMFPDPECHTIKLLNLLNVMISYFNHLLDVTHYIAATYYNYDSTVYPTVEQYCEGLSSNSSNIQ